MNRTSALWLLFGINLLNFFDRQILATVTEPLRHEWSLTDTQLGWLITAFTLLYAVVGLPLGRMADTRRRSLILAIGLALWSALTVFSGFCRGFWQLFAARMGVGIGEASCAPAASSLIGDLYRPNERARAMSIFMLGLPVGVSLSYLVGGYIAQHYGWRAVFYIAGLPGLILAIAAFFLPEPVRGQSEDTKAGAAHRGSPEVDLESGVNSLARQRVSNDCPPGTAGVSPASHRKLDIRTCISMVWRAGRPRSQALAHQPRLAAKSTVEQSHLRRSIMRCSHPGPTAGPGRSLNQPIETLHRSGSPILLVLGIPTMRWIILSGLLHNFVMYAFTFFLPSFLVRYHGTTIQMAGFISALLVGTVGALGMLVGGWLGDASRKQWQHGRMLVAGTAVLFAAPAAFFALQMPSGSLPAFIVFQGFAAFLMYAYYPTVYATIHDVIEPALRGRAMAIYFFAMYILGASMGPVITGSLSDYLGQRAATLAGLANSEQFRAQGLHQAMYLVPALTLVLAVILFAGALTTPRDIHKLQSWQKT